jgi:hypothetical protein
VIIDLHSPDRNQELTSTKKVSVTCATTKQLSPTRVSRTSRPHAMADLRGDSVSDQCALKAHKSPKKTPLDHSQLAEVGQTDFTKSFHFGAEVE